MLSRRGIAEMYVYIYMMDYYVAIKNNVLKG